uniref:Retrotransposon Copia-like N-terminal domain-containing protein n=1 Tax=Cannabis sativa TaxID=3483 RepID=A0A803QQC0_CANSA
MATSSGEGASSNNYGVSTTMFLPPLCLDSNNYFFWRFQVLPAIRAYDLEGILLNRNHPQPQIRQPLESTTMVNNPEFIRWHRLDQFLLSWLLSLLFLNPCWVMLSINTKKGSLVIHEYLLKMKNFADGLRAAGNQITEEQLILYVLAGLGTNYEDVVVNLTSRDQFKKFSSCFKIMKRELKPTMQHSWQISMEPQPISPNLRNQLLLILLVIVVLRMDTEGGEGIQMVAVVTLVAEDPTLRTVSYVNYVGGLDTQSKTATGDLRSVSMDQMTPKSVPHLPIPTNPLSPYLCSTWHSL